MNRFRLALLLFAALFLSGCSLRQDAETLYKQEQPLQAEIFPPEAIAEDRTANITVFLTQNGEAVEQADYVHMVIGKQDGTVVYPMEEAVKEGEGLYSLRKQFRSDGLYYAEVHALSNGSVISPRIRFVVGELSESDKQLLEQGGTPPQGRSGHHH